MKLRFTVPRRAVPRAVVLTVCVALVPLPVMAGETKAPSKAAQTEIAKAPEPRALRAAIEQADLRDLKAPAEQTFE